VEEDEGDEEEEDEVSEGGSVELGGEEDEE
jgi:hypothetical protein